MLCICNATLASATATRAEGGDENQDLAVRNTKPSSRRFHAQSTPSPHMHVKAGEGCLAVASTKSWADVFADEASLAHGGDYSGMISMWPDCRRLGSYALWGIPLAVHSPRGLGLVI